jgi:hypothetical protein
MEHNISVGNSYKAINGTIYTVERIAMGFVCSRVDKNGKKLPNKNLNSDRLMRLTPIK